MSYLPKLSREAEKKLDRATYDRIERRIIQLTKNPFDPRLSTQLEVAEGMRSSRVGDWRILYTVHPQARIIYVIAIRPRDEAYRDL